MHTAGYETVKADSVISRVSLEKVVQDVRTRTITWRRQIRILQFRCGAHVSSVSKKKVPLKLKSSLRFSFWREQLAWMHTQKREALVALYAALPKNHTNRNRKKNRAKRWTCDVHLYYFWLTIGVKSWLGTINMANYFWYHFIHLRIKCHSATQDLTKVSQSSLKPKWS